MSQNMQPAFCSNIILNPNKIISYKGENYNVDFDLIKRNCKYFYDNRSDFDSLDQIEMVEPIDLPQKTIQTFLNCSQNQLTYIEDILGINYLSIKYQNSELLKFTQDYIKNNYNQLIFQSFSLKSKLQSMTEYALKQISEINIDTSDDEKILASHFMEYIEDDRIFTLSINVIDRVMKLFLNENKEIFQDENSKKKINNFLLRCLKEYKKSGSILFLNINFDKLDRDLIISLHNDYADVFDFNMLNVRSIFESTYELIGENTKIMTSLKEISDRQISEMNAFNEYKLSIEKQLNDIRSDMKKLSDDQITSLGKIQTLENKNTDFEGKLHDVEQKQQNNLASEIQALKNKNNEFEGKLRDVDSKENNLSSEIQALKNKNNEFEGKFRNIDSKENNLSDRIQSLEGKQRNTESQISQQSQKQQSMQSSLNQMTDKISKYATREI